MRIALYGGMANNLYVVAGALTALGADVLFIRDRDNHTVFSQPCWQDVRAVMTHDQWTVANRWDAAAWAAWEARAGWEAPGWLADPHDAPGPLPALDAPVPVAQAVRFLYRASPHAGAVLRHMRSCDAVVACGVHASLLAMTSGRPYCIWPHGADIRMAAGLGRSAPGASWRTRASEGLTRGLLRRAYRKARFVVYANPTAGGGHAGDILHGRKDWTFRMIPFPVPLHAAPEPDAKPELLAEALREAGEALPGAGLTGLVPSRLDFYWKGQDMLLRGLATSAARGVRLLFTGWGADLGRARDMAAALGVADRCAFIPRVFSKPMLRGLAQGADFVVDQFRSGHPGTSAMEAMGCATPVMMHLDARAFARENVPAPPVIQASDEQAVAAFLAAPPDRTDLAARGAGARAWLAAHHAPGRVVEALIPGLGLGRPAHATALATPNNRTQHHA